MMGLIRNHGSRVRATACGTVLLLVLAGCGIRPAADVPPAQRKAPWSEAVVQAVAALPIQDGGRIKPLQTFASYALLHLNHRRSAEMPYVLEDGAYRPRAKGESAGAKLEPVPWLLDVMLYPEQAEHYRVFMVEDSEILTKLGVEARRKRDRYSRAEIEPGASKLFELGSRYERMEKRDRLQNEILKLFRSVALYDRIESFAGAMHASLEVPKSDLLREVLGDAVTRGADGVDRLRFVDALAKAEPIVATFRKLRERDAEGLGVALDDLDAEIDAANTLLRALLDTARDADTFALLPPADQATETWMSPAGMLEAVFEGRNEAIDPAHLAGLAQLAQAQSKRDDGDALAEVFGAVRATFVPLAEQRGEYRSVPLEQTYLKLEPFFWSLVAFLLGFVVLVFSWLLPRGKLMHWSAFGLTAIALGLAVTGVTMRCIIMQRPPITGIWDTIPFITGTGVFFLLILEIINRKRLALPVATSIGVLGMLLAMAHETMNGTDTMRVLVAVLDSNFWLTTHVIAINLGYMAPLVAGALGIVYVVGRLFNVGSHRARFYKELGRMMNGAIAFGLVFAVVGTILGGVWANDSWGRFWGWDPKENGALLICLWLIATLHARLGGYIRTIGVATASIFGASIVCFSWFHTNMLGIGLHAYGATAGSDALWATYYGLWTLTGLGCLAGMLDKLRVENERRVVLKASV